MKRLVIAVLAAGISACSTGTAPRVGGEFDLLIHQRTAVEGTPLLVEFDAVLEDSRCPRNAMCIQAGRAAVQLFVTYASGPDILHILTLVDRPDSSTAVVGGWFVDFIALNPYPTVGQQVDPDRRVVRLRLRPALD